MQKQLLHLNTLVKTSDSKRTKNFYIIHLIFKVRAGAGICNLNVWGLQLYVCYTA